MILAAASMQEALEAVAASWEREGNPRPVLSFSASPALARQIAEGAPADLVITSDRRWMDWLAEQGKLAGEPVAFATNGLVAVAPRDASGPVSLADFAADPDGGRIALAETRSVPAGQFAREALENLGHWEALADRVVPGENVRVALALAERGEVPLAVVYASDAQASQRVHVVERLDPGLHSPIVYYAAIVAGSDNEAAQRFLDYLTGDQGRAVITSRGFGWP